MSKFITSSVWNFTANFIVRIMSFITFPFLVRYYLKEDISIFRSFQAFVLILMAIIPIGTNILYFSVPKEERQGRWNLFFNTSLLISIMIALLFALLPSLSSFFIPGELLRYIHIIMILVPLMEGCKVILITRLTAIMDFKSISIALIVKQLILYACVISFSFINPILLILFLIVFISEVIELIMLFIRCISLKVNIAPSLSTDNINSDSKKGKLWANWLKSLQLDKLAKKYITCSGIEQIFLAFATQFPTVFVVIVLGRSLAPEFQLPFTAVTLPVSLVMNSIARVSFPHFSNLRDDDKIVSSLYSVLFSITFILFPIMAVIHFFASEISLIFLDESWAYAVFALRVFPVMIMVYMLNIPSSYVSNVKGKPQINLVYAIVLFTVRILSIYVGYKVAGFIGTVSFFVVGDMIVRIIRIRIDINLLNVNIKHYFNNLRYNCYAFTILITSLWVFQLGIMSLFPLLESYIAKIISFLIAVSLSLSLNYYWEKRRLKEVVGKLIKGLKEK